MVKLRFYALLNKLWKGVKNPMSDFKSSLEYGKKGEELVKTELLKKNWVVIDVSQNPKYQEEDVDLIIQKDGKVHLIEVKNATSTLNSHDTVSVEDVYMLRSDYIKRPGWLWKSQAEYFMFTNTEKNLFYEVNVQSLRKYVYDENFRKTKRIPTGIEESQLMEDHVYDEPSGYKKSWVYFINIQDLCNKGIAKKRVCLNF